MGTAGPSGFHSANTHMELLVKAVQTHRFEARGCRERKEEQEGEGEVGITEKEINKFIEQ